MEENWKELERAELGKKETKIRKELVVEAYLSSTVGVGIGK